MAKKIIRSSILFIGDYGCVELDEIIIVPVQIVVQLKLTVKLVKSSRNLAITIAKLNFIFDNSHCIK